MGIAFTRIRDTLFRVFICLHVRDDFTDFTYLMENISQDLQI